PESPVDQQPTEARAVDVDVGLEEAVILRSNALDRAILSQRYRNDLVDDPPDAALEGEVLEEARELRSVEVVAIRVLHPVLRHLRIRRRRVLGKVLAHPVVEYRAVQVPRRSVRVAQRGGREARVVERLRALPQAEPPLGRAEPGHVLESLERMVEMALLRRP